MSDVTSASSTASTGSLLRITGMASGLDVDAMVKKMVTADQYKIDKASQDTQTVQWKQDAYNDIIKGVKDLQNSFFDTMSPSTSLLASNAYSAFDVKVNDVDATSAAITAGVGSQVGTYKISFTVPAGGHLAKAADVESSDKIMTNASPQANALNSSKLSDLGVLSGSYSMTANYDNKDGMGPQSKIINFTDTNTLSDISTMINTATGNSVKARYSELTGHLSIQTNLTGDGTSLNIKVTGSGTSAVTFMQKLNLSGTTDSASGTAGTDAQFDITAPGAATSTTVKKSSNNFTIDGISYNLTSENNSSFTVVQNSQKVYDKISTFLDKYNTLVDMIQTKISETKDKDFNPLTDSQKSSMSESSITTWNAKAKIGILRNDNNLSNILRDMRSSFTSAVTNSGLSFGQYGSNAIGLDTSDDSTQGGKITIVNKSLLMDAISNHSDQISNFFANTSTAASTDQQYNESGVFSRIKDILIKNVGVVGTTFTSSILTQYANLQDDYSISGAGGKNTIPDQLYAKQQLVKQLTQNLKDDQDKYYLQFSHLETIMNNLNNQQSQLSSMLGTK